MVPQRSRGQERSQSLSKQHFPSALIDRSPNNSPCRREMHAEAVCGLLAKISACRMCGNDGSISVRRAFRNFICQGQRPGAVLRVGGHVILAVWICACMRATNCSSPRNACPLRLPQGEWSQISLPPHAAPFGRPFAHRARGRVQRLFSGQCACGKITSQRCRKGAWDARAGFSRQRACQRAAPRFFLRGTARKKSRRSVLLRQKQTEHPFH